MQRSHITSLLASLRPTQRISRALVPLLVLTCAIAGCEGTDVQETSAVTTKTVEIAASRAIFDRREVRAIGRLEAAEEANAGFVSAGVIAAVEVEIGDRIRAGQVLARLDTTALDANVAQARDHLAQARRDLVRLRSLNERQLIARQQYDDAATRVDLAEAAARSAGYAQRYGRIVAAADGVVLARLAEPGEVVTAGQPVLRLSGEREGWQLTVELADRDGAQIQPGDEAEVEIDAAPGQRFPARIVRVGGSASARSGAIAVELRVIAPKASLRSGLVAKARIRLPGQRMSAVPVSALVEADLGRGIIFIAEPAAGGLLRARRHEVRLGELRGGMPHEGMQQEGMQEEGMIEIVAGLPADAQVVVAGAAFLRDGETVRRLVRR